MHVPTHAAPPLSGALCSLNFKLSYCVSRGTGVAYLQDTESAKTTPIVAAMSLYWPSFIVSATGQYGENGLAFAESWLPFCRAIADLARAHVDESTRVNAAQYLGTFGPWEAALRHSSWDWDRIFGTNGELLLLGTHGYNFDVRKHLHFFSCCAKFQSFLSFAMPRLCLPPF